MNIDEQDWRRQRDDRSLRYAGRTLDPKRRIFVRLDPDYSKTYAGQVAVLVVTNLLSRMTPSVTLDLPEVTVVEPLPRAGVSLRAAVIEMMRRSDPFGDYQIGPSEGEFILALGGNQPARWHAHGAGWNCHFGSSTSPLAQVLDFNPFGAALSAILACAHVFAADFAPVNTNFRFNAYDWQQKFLPETDSHVLSHRPLGEIWTVGAGSVGSAALYFTALWTRRFRLTLFDHDVVKVHNLDRSPIFGWQDVGYKKVEAVSSFLKGLGLEGVRSIPVALHQSDVWSGRQAGQPDLMISAANEFNVRYQIESGSPPAQIYATTGVTWQAAVMRHIPLVDPCSCCIFPPGKPAEPTACATDSLRPGEDDKAEQVDASLPFLSFAAGLMAAAEIAKLGNPALPTSNRTLLYTKDAQFRTVAAPMVRRVGCICEDRSRMVHTKMIEATNFSHLSGY